jgi:hypothetical protein
MLSGRAVIPDAAVEAPAVPLDEGRAVILRYNCPGL